MDASVREALRALRAASLSESFGARVVKFVVVPDSGSSAFRFGR